MALDRLPPDQRAVLQLVLQRGRTYDDIADMLSIDRAGVRERALGASDALGPDSELEPVRRGLITDYLLGQLPDAVADDVRGRLAEHPDERAWARVVAGELMPLGGDRLPEIPAAAPRARESEAAPVAAAVAAPPREKRRRGAERREEDEPIQFGERRERERRGAAEDGAAPRSSRLGGALLLGGGLAVIIAVVLVVLLSGDSKHKTTSTPTPTAPGSVASASTSTTSSATASAKPIAQVNLSAPGGGKTPAGAAIVVRQGAQTGLLIRAQGLTPNTTHDAYAVWLSNPSGTPSQILGFVNPGVGKTGVLQTAGALPAGASRFKELLVTLETQAKPKAPGHVILQGALTIAG